MTTELEKTETQMPMVPADVSVAALEAAIGMGDFSRLTTSDRLRYIAALCQTTGLNPLTRPFEIISLDGKLALYARKDCAEQLRKLHNVSVQIMERNIDNGVLIVRVKASMPNGRFDESVGAVSMVYPERCKINGNWVNNPKSGKALEGADWANAVMKAETKAKRRVSLSICGLGMLDESELETVNGHKRAAAASQIVEQAETAQDRAAKLNQLTQGAVDVGEVRDAVEITPPKESGSTSNQNETGASTGAVIETAKAPADGGSSDAPLNFEGRSASLPLPTPLPDPLPIAPQTAQRGEGMLSEELVMDLQRVFSEKTPEHQTQCISYIISQGKLERGKGLETVPEAYATKILGNTKGFHQAVERSVKK